MPISLSSSFSFVRVDSASPDPLSPRNDSSALQTDGVQQRAAEQAQQRELQLLKNRDREVRAHELAHVAAGGQYVTSGARLEYEKGPDGRLYAVGGEVSIDTSPIAGDPRATLLKAQVIQRAAMAPANPSAQDRQVAAQAGVMALQARVELAVESREDGVAAPGSSIDTFV